MILGVFSNGKASEIDLGSYAIDLSAIGSTFLRTAKEVAIALVLIVAFFAVLQFTCLHLPKKKLAKIGVGVGFTFIGLLIFLTAVSVGFMPVGYRIGQCLADLPVWAITLIGFTLGLVVVLADPRYTFLTNRSKKLRIKP